MTDNKENRKSFEEFIAETVERQYNMDAPKTITPQELEERLKKRQKQRRARRLRTVGFAAVFVIAVICTSIGFNALTTNVGADKNDKEEIRTEDGVVIEDGGWGSSSEDKVVITEWAEIDIYRASNPKIISLKYIPEEYKFEKLVIEYIETGDLKCEYIFENHDNIKLEIEEYVQETGVNIFAVEGDARVIDSAKGNIYIKENESKKAIIQFADGINIIILGALSDNEIIKIVDSIRF